MMRKGHVRILLAGCAAVLAATLGATTALAATTWTIKPGGSTSAKSGNAIFIDTATGTKITCQSMTTTGTFKSGSGLSGSDAGSITGVGFNHCTGPLGVTISYRATDLPWHINVTSYKSGVVTGTISHMQIKMTGPSCAGVIDGTSATASDGRPEVQLHRQHRRPQAAHQWRQPALLRRPRLCWPVRHRQPGHSRRHPRP